MLCLDEPTAGVAQRETEAFGPLIMEIRRELGASMLVIEHDMPLIMGISDRVYCLELGPRHRRGRSRRRCATTRWSIASYLGTDERAIQRSGAMAKRRSTNVAADRHHDEHSQPRERVRNADAETPHRQPRTGSHR